MITPALAQAVAHQLLCVLKAECSPGDDAISLILNSQPSEIREAAAREIMLGCSSREAPEAVAVQILRGVRAREGDSPDAIARAFEDQPAEIRDGFAMTMVEGAKDADERDTHRYWGQKLVETGVAKRFGASVSRSAGGDRA
jgi:hypothetical protein